VFFSKACEYAIKTMIYIRANQESGKRVGLREISSQIKSPEAFTAKILQQLVKGGLLVSLRGPQGGFEISQSNAEISLMDVVRIFDGDGMIRNCVLGLESCSSEHPCAVHGHFVALRDRYSNVLINTSLDDVAEDYRNHRTRLVI
jgi:Rrf2 family protein